MNKDGLPVSDWFGGPKSGTEERRQERRNGTGTDRNGRTEERKVPFLQTTRQHIKLKNTGRNLCFLEIKKLSFLEKKYNFKLERRNGQERRNGEIRS